MVGNVKRHVWLWVSAFSTSTRLTLAAHRSAERAETGPSRGAAPVATPAWSSPHAENTAPLTIRGHPVPPCATAPAPLHSFVECFGPRPTPFSTPVCAQSSTKHSPKGLFRG